MASYNFLTLTRIPVKFMEIEPTVWVAEYPKRDGMYNRAELWIECYQFVSKLSKSPTFKGATPVFSLTLKERKNEEVPEID